MQTALVSLTLIVAGIFFDVIPFLAAILLPAVSIPFLISLTKDYDDTNLTGVGIIFTTTTVILAILANLFWNLVLYNHIYFEWDRLGLPYTFFSHEGPLLDGKGTWIAPGWTLTDLYLVWLGITLFIFILSGLIALSFHKKISKKQIKFIVLSIIFLTLTSLFMSWALPYLLPRLLYFFALTVGNFS